MAYRGRRASKTPPDCWRRPRKAWDTRSGRWTLVTRALQKGTLRLAGKGALPYGLAYYFVCPKNFLTLPKVAQFRDWILAAARDFPKPDGLSAPSAR